MVAYNLLANRCRIHRHARGKRTVPPISGRLGSHAWCHSLRLSRIAGVERHPCKRRHPDCTTVRPCHSSGASLSPEKLVLVCCWHLAQARLGLASTPHQACPTLPERLSVSIPLALPSSVPSSVETSLLRRDKPPPALHVAASDAHDVPLPCVHARTLTRVNA